MYVPAALVGGYSRDADMSRQLAALKAFASPLSYVVEANQGGDRTLSGGAIRRGVLALGTELGGSGHVTRAALHIAERGVNNLLVHLGILPEQTASRSMARPARWRSAAPTTTSTRRTTACTNRWSSWATWCCPASRRRASTSPRRRGRNR